MKNKMYLTFFILIFAIVNSYSQVGIGTDTPNPAAVLDLTSTNKGLLPPRMTKTEVEAIVTPPAGLFVWCSDCGSNGEALIYSGTSWNNLLGGSLSNNFGTITTSTGKVWMDRNLGASRVATSSTDDLAKGSLFQWGREADGHELVNRTGTTPSAVNSGITAANTLNYSNYVGSNVFIRNDNDWLSPQNDNLWQGVNGINNPCPTGFRVPTVVEFNNELSGLSLDVTGGGYSRLKLTTTGVRYGTDGLFYSNNLGWYWTSTFDRTGAIKKAKHIYIGTTTTLYSEDLTTRGNALAVRCIKN